MFTFELDYTRKNVLTSAILAGEPQIGVGSDIDGAMQCAYGQRRVGACIEEIMVVNRICATRDTIAGSDVRAAMSGVDVGELRRRT